MKRAALAALAVAAASTAALAQHRYATVEFDELLAAHVKARVGVDRLPAMSTGPALTEPAVYVTATPSRVLVYGETAVALDAGRAAAADTATCDSGAACLPRLRDAIIEARARLGHRLDARPKVLLLVGGNVPYETLLLVARSAAEAGAPHSLRLVGRRGPELVAMPVWVAPGRSLVLSEVSSPRLITVEVTDGGAATVRSRGDADVRAPTIADLLAYLGQLQLSSGRTTYFLTAAADTPSGDVAKVAARVREIFPNVVLHERAKLETIVR